MKSSILSPKTLFLLFVSILGAIISHGQTKVDAMDIERALKAGENVSYSNATITGVLDMTSGREEAKEYEGRRSWTNNEVKNRIKGSVEFYNCTFEDHVYAYYNDESAPHTGTSSKYTFTTDFDSKVIFKDCKFRERAWFKYSEFDEISDFSGTTFEGSSTFKYAKFPESTSFKNALFEDDSTFKYTKFDEHVSFANAIFEEDAIFKYTEFDNGVSFNNALFKDDLDFKYTQVDGDYDDTNMLVEGEMDTKYTKIKNRSRKNRKSKH